MYVHAQKRLKSQLRGDVVDKKVDVIATFNTEGQMRPLWLQIPSDKESKPIKVLEATRAQQDFVWGLYMTFLCQIINRYGNKQEIKLRYHKKDMYWEVVCNNSAPL